MKLKLKCCETKFNLNGDRKRANQVEKKENCFFKITTFGLVCNIPFAVLSDQSFSILPNYGIKIPS